MTLGKRASVLGPVLDAHTDHVSAGGIVSTLTATDIVNAISRVDSASQAGDNVVRTVNGIATVATMRSGLGENIPTVASIIDQAQLVARGSNRAFIAGQVFGAAVDLIGFNGGEIILGYDAGDGASDTVVEGALEVKGGANMRELRVDGVTAGHIKTGTIYADAIASAGLQAEQSLTLGTGNSFDYGTLRFDPDALWIDTSSPFVSSLKPMVIHKGDYAGTNYLAIQPVTDAAKEYWQLLSTHNLSFGVAVDNLMVLFGSAGAATWLDLAGSAGDGPVWKSSNYAHWWSNLGKTQLYGLDLSSSSRVNFTTTSNKFRQTGSTGAWIETNLTGSASDGPRLDSSGYKFTLYDSGGTRNFQLDMSNSAGAALKSWTNKLYVTHTSTGASLTVDVSGSAADGPRLDSSGSLFTFYNSAGTRNFQLDLSNAAGVAYKAWTNKHYFSGAAGAVLTIDVTGSAADGPRLDSSGETFTLYNAGGTRSVQLDLASASYLKMTASGGFRFYVGADYVQLSPNAAGVQIDLNASSRIWYLNAIPNTNTEYRVANVKVLGARATGWTAWTGTAQRGTKDADAVSLTDTARALKALIDDLIAHGLIGT